MKTLTIQVVLVLVCLAGLGFAKGPPPRNLPNLFGTSFHVATVPLIGGAIMIQVSTLSPATNVRITGQLGGQTIDTTQTVSRLSAWEYVVDPSYFPTSTDINWKVEIKSLKIEATPDPVGVKVMIEEGTTHFTAYVAYPDISHGRDYRTVDYRQPDGQVVIIGTVDKTNVTLNLTAFDATEKAFITIDGQAAAGLNIVTITLDEYETLHIHCDDCSNIGINSDQELAVINGGMFVKFGASAAGYTMNQIPPLHFLDTDFVQFPKDSTHTKRVFYTTGLVGQPGTYTRDEATGVAFTDEATVDTNTVGTQVQFSVPVYAYTASERTNYRSYVMLPGLKQWTTHHYFYLTPGYDYDVKIIAKVGQIGLIKEITSSSTRELGTIGGQMKTVNPLLGEPVPVYEVFQYTIQVTVADMYEWRAPPPFKKRFLVVVTQFLGNGNSARGAGLLSFGTALAPPKKPKGRIGKQV